MNSDKARRWPYELFGAEVMAGWRPLVDRLVAAVDQARAAGEPVEIFQVKEKFGAIRIYLEPSTPDLDALIETLEKESVTICEQCGEPGKLGGTGWVKTLCQKHREEADAPPAAE